MILTTITFSSSHAVLEQLERAPSKSALLGDSPHETYPRFEPSPIAYSFGNHPLTTLHTSLSSIIFLRAAMSLQGLFLQRIWPIFRACAEALGRWHGLTEADFFCLATSDQLHVNNTGFHRCLWLNEVLEPRSSVGNLVVDELKTCTSTGMANLQMQSASIFYVGDLLLVTSVYNQRFGAAHHESYLTIDYCKAVDTILSKVIYIMPNLCC